MTTQRVTVLNASEAEKTLAMLRQATKKAGTKTRAYLDGLKTGLKANPQPSARGRTAAQEATMAKRKAKARKHTSRAKRSNPTTKTRVVYRTRKATKRTRRRTNPTTGGSFNLQGIAMDAAAIVAGGLAQRLLQKQLTKMLPQLSPGITGAVSGAALAFAALKFGKGKQIAKQLAVGAAASALGAIAAGMMPSLFAGDDEVGDIPPIPYYVDGVIDQGDDVNGIIRLGDEFGADSYFNPLAS